MKDIPPEVLLNIFDWATRDDGLLNNVPSWKYYTFSDPDPNNPWYAPSVEVFNTANSIARVCKQWRMVASEFYLRHLIIRTSDEVERLVNQLRSEPHLKHWVKRLNLAVVTDTSWTPGDTRRICELIQLCPDVGVVENNIIARSGTCGCHTL